MPPSADTHPPELQPSAVKLSAILLAGGRGSRMGGVEKALLRRGQQTQIQRWLQELQRLDIRTVVVGPPSLKPQIPTPVPLVRETPAFAGPAAGVLAGAVELQRHERDTSAGAAPAGWTLLLAVDLTEPAPLLDWLLGQLEDSAQSEAATGTDDPEGAPAALLPCDHSGRHQYLSAAVPTGWLLRRAGALTPEEVEHRPLRWLLSGLEDAARLRHPVVPRGLSEDVDTLHDAHRLGVHLP
ncbi:NTP transferase domain-containing protein [Nesterenkonia sp. LB17]|uniref:NTP transferase domain-containing protein n=1 Tax=Nesterenkonia sp. LB17 TaxID=2901230 RepID=UPI001F4C59CE|nr:NTP transferase domain-containing protein [Nesterenkonia sp. LB17]MCH8565980.1 NTP transferase domain-containing protein [Nesterenkonia sp. LB17]